MLQFYLEKKRKLQLIKSGRKKNNKVVFLFFDEEKINKKKFRIRENKLIQINEECNSK